MLTEIEMCSRCDKQPAIARSVPPGWDGPVCYGCAHLPLGHDGEDPLPYIVERIQAIAADLRRRLIRPA